MPFEMVRQVDHMLEVRAIDASNQASFADEKNRFQTIAQMMNTPNQVFQTNHGEARQGPA